MRLIVAAGLALLCGAPAGAQTTAFSLVKQFLALSDSQTDTILKNNDSYNDLVNEKQRRIFQVQSEIVDETNKDSLDPMSLGVRYMEIELICRDLKDQARQMRAKNLGVLSDEQKKKLTVLEDAMKLAPTINDSVEGNLLGAIDYVPGYFTGENSRGGGYYSSGGAVSLVYGCDETRAFIVGDIGSGSSTAPDAARGASASLPRRTRSARPPASSR